MSELDRAPDDENGVGQHKASATILPGILATIAVILVCGSLVLGVQLRNRIDLTGESSANSALNGLFASNDPKDDSIPLVPYYNQVVSLLKEKYVDPVNDNSKLANGAVRGMVVSLDDPDSRYLSSDDRAIYLEAQAGVYQGIGIDLGKRLTSKREQMNNGGVSESEFTLDVPELVVQDVAPDSPAAKAGVLPGDIVYSVDGHWVINPLVLKHFGDAIKKFKTQSAQLKAAKAEQSILEGLLNSKPITPNRAFSQLTSGTNGSINVVWSRNSRLIQTKLTKAITSSLQSRVFAPNTIRLRFTNGASDFLAKFLQDDGNLTIDLRDQPNGNYDEMLKCLKLLLPSGSYGGFSDGSQEFEPLQIQGTSNHRKVTLLVDNTVKNAAAIFALVLERAGVANLIGKLQITDQNKITYHSLPEHCAFTLNEGTYQEKQSNGTHSENQGVSS